MFKKSLLFSLVLALTFSASAQIPGPQPGSGGGGITASEVASAPLARISGSTYSSVQHLQDVFHSSGITSGGGITDDTDGTITVAAGTGLIRATNSSTATIYFTDWAAESGANVALADNDMNYIYVEYNAGSPQVIATTTKRADYETNILLATVYRSGTTLHISDQSAPWVGDHAARMIRRLTSTMPFSRSSGGVLSEVGTRNIAVTAGTWWEGLLEFNTTALDTSAAGTFRYFYRDGGGGFTEVTGQTQINNTQYDNGTGTLATLSNNFYGVHWVYVAQDSDYYVLYGQGDYTLTQAQDADAPASVPGHFGESHAKLIGKIIIEKSASSFTRVFSAFDTALTTSSAADHGGLAGLGDDDHTQYSLISSQGGAPSSTPSRVGEVNVDTTNDEAYISTGTSSSADWNKVTPSGEILLSTTTSIDGKSATTTNLYTVPSGKTAIITKAVIEMENAVAPIVIGAAGIGIASGEDDIFDSRTLTGLDANGKAYLMSAANSTYVTAAASDVIKLGVDTSYTGTTVTLTVHLFGLLI